MSEPAISGIVLACVLGGTLLGISLRAALPDHHLSADSRDAVRLATGLVATMAALILGLLIASAKSSYEAQRSEVVQLSADVIMLDRILAHYGPEATDVRGLLRRSVANALDRIWPSEGRRAQLEPTVDSEAFYDGIHRLAPRNDAQRLLQTQAVRISAELGRGRWLLFEREAGSIPMPFLVLLAFWLTIIFLNIGLFAPPNATVIATTLMCAVSISGALFLILELDRPFDGVIQISSAPLRDALAHLGR